MQVLYPNETSITPFLPKTPPKKHKLGMYIALKASSVIKHT
jgi:hypothetical protein